MECGGRVRGRGVWEGSKGVWSVGGEKRGVDCGRREKGPAKLVPCNT